MRMANAKVGQMFILIRASLLSYCFPVPCGSTGMKKDEKKKKKIKSDNNDNI